MKKQQTLVAVTHTHTHTGIFKNNYFKIKAVKKLTDIETIRSKNYIRDG